MFILRQVSTITMNPSIWHNNVSTHDWGKVSTAGGLYYYIEFKYLTHEVSTHHWGKVSTAKDQLLHWVPASGTMMSIHITEAQYLLLEVCSTTLSPSIWHHDVNTHDWGTVSTAGGLFYYIESHYLTHEVSTHPWRQVSTAKRQYNYIESNIWHMKSVHITETKVLLLEVRITTLSPSIWHQVVSIYDWGKVSFARGLYYYIESKYLTSEVSTYP